MDNIIEQLKQNGYILALWPEIYGEELAKAMLAKAKEIQGAKQDPPIFDAYLPRPHGWTGAHLLTWADDSIYRLRAEYTEPVEDEYELCEIYDDDLCLVFDKWKKGINIVYATSDPRFAGFEFKDIFIDETQDRLWMNLDINHDGNYKWTHATHVRFKKEVTT
jgi:hypothetical protein